MSSPGVTVTLAYTLREDYTPIFCAMLPDMLKDTAKRPGFRSIKVVQNKDRPNDLLFFEEWDSEADYHAYLAWRRERGDTNRPQGFVVKQQLDFWPTVIAQEKLSLAVNTQRAD
jgi:quinol monooxygenase YgiN